MSGAEFTIEGDPYANLGFDAANGAVLSLVLEDTTYVRKVVFSQVQKSKDAPDLVFSPVSGQPATPGGAVTVTMPAAGGHTYILRCQINDGTSADASKIAAWTKERAVAVRIGGYRKIAPAESTQYDATNGWAGAFDELVDAIAVGALPGGGAAGEIITTDGTTPAWALVADANVDPAAAIAGSKIDPDFGAQDILTSGGLSLGNGQPLLLESSPAGSPVQALYLNTSEELLVGGADAGARPTNVILDGQAFVELKTVGSFRLIVSSGSLDVRTPVIEFEGTTVATPIIRHGDDSTASITGDALTIHAQDCTGATSVGGDLVQRPGSGTSANGDLRLQDGSANDRIVVDTDGNTTIVADADTGYVALQGVSYYSFDTTVPGGNPTTELWSIAAPDNSTITLTLEVNASDATADQVAYYERVTLFRRVSGTLTSVLDNQRTVLEEDATWNCAAGPSGSNVRILGTPDATNDTRFQGRVKMLVTPL